MMLKLGFVLLCLMVAAPAVADERLYRLSEAVAVVGHAADLSATQRCLGSGRCHELNPWLGRYDHPVTFAVAKMSVASLGLYATSKIPNKTLGMLANYAIGATFTAIAIRNVRITR